MGIKKFWKKKSEKLFRASNVIWDYWGVKSHLGVLGRQMPPRGIGASNATWGYRGVKCHLGVLGRQMPPGGIGASNATLVLWGSQRPHGRQKAGVKVHEESNIGASEIRGVRDQVRGQGSKFGRQGSRRQRSRASKEMNPYISLL